MSMFLTSAGSEELSWNGPSDWPGQATASALTLSEISSKEAASKATAMHGSFEVT